MKVYYRALKNKIKDAILRSDKVILLYGARQTGKTTLIKGILKELSLHSLIINADEIRYIDVLSSRDLNKMKLLVKGYDLLFIDEAQRVPEIGINIKILHDSLPGLKIILTGSSSLELANQTKEPLTGRLDSYILYPMAWIELLQHYSAFDLSSNIEEFLMYGSYPETLQIENGTQKQKYLLELSSSYLFKDILELSSIRHSRKIVDLLRMLAFQTGSQVSMTEVGSSLGMSKDTVSTYIDLLEKSFVLFRLSGFSRNLRKEVTKMDKFYFYDLGIRNALINNFNPLSLRNDQGTLWENYLIMERVKRAAYLQKFTNFYFWRTYSGAELDLVEERDGSLFAFEIKFGKKKPKVPAYWSSTYPEADFQFINSKNFMDFIG